MSDSAANLSGLPLASGEKILPEELLVHVLNISLTGIILYEPVYDAGTSEITDLKFQYLNVTAQNMLGLPEQPRETFLQLYPHAREAGIFDFYRDTFLSSKAGYYNVNYQHDGLDNYFRLAAQRSGQLLVVSFTDTSDQDRSAAEEALRESQVREQAALADAERHRQQLHHIFMQAPALICIFEGPQHIFKLVNPPYQQLVGNRPILGKPIAEAMPELAGQPIFELLNQVYRTGENFYAHEMLVQLDHDNAGALGQNYYNFIYQPTRDLNGEIDGILVFAYEVTTQVVARQQVEESRRKVQALNEELEVQVQNRTRQLLQAQTEAEHQRLRLERLFMQAPAAICILNGPDLVFELINPGYQQLFPGRPLLGKPVLEALPEIINQPIATILKKVFQTGETFEGRELLVPLARHLNGPVEELYFNFVYQARYNRESQIDGIVVFAFEVTDQVRARQASDASAQQLRLITDALPVLVGYLDKQEKYRFVNKAYELWFNLKPEEMLGKPVLEIIGEQAYQNAKPYIERALAGNRVDFEATMPYREDFVKHTRTTYVPDIKGDKIAGFYTMVTDITEQMESRLAVEKSEQQAKALAQELAAANQELLEANQQLTQTNVDLDNFIYTASHDLKGPILNIEGLMVALQEDLPTEHAPSDSLQYTMNLILNSVQRFKQTIEHLTEITKLQKENNTNTLLVELAPLLEDVQLDLAPVIKATNARIHVDIANCPTIQFSQKNLRSILYNLLSNAIKYHAPERAPQVFIHCSEAPEYHILSVRDNGLGINLNQKHKIFAMFNRLHDHVEGSGIGLYMVKKIIENASGRIEVDSEVSKGSTFRVYFRRNS